MNQITTITFFKYKGIFNKFWALRMMGLMPLRLKSIAGQSFYRLMGSGQNKFKPWPNWSVYALLQVWDNEASADLFFAESNVIDKFKSKSEHHYTLFLKNISAKGSWIGKNPFQRSTSLDPNQNKIAVITRATIKWNKLFRFWNYVPISRKDLVHNKGLLYTQGIGTIPFLQMATFSLWKDKEALLEFAYKQPHHAKAITKTKKLNWYREELFSRFQPFKSLGNWSDEGLTDF
ncbi:DUF3291 domain-containing protein [Aquimarina brevivitae]|uniref:Spheroidene monooxygenase n=1 Tax=Aquimarina brevivitae TaxID=323412 RepID=A0A4Q7P1L3_9FLAO|nr:DUF3291 domain-containing protein [Aquimarina brevivitae]RZS93208.1 spheroidene monooxygenase [Aquimarina brevivitae]